MIFGPCEHCDCCEALWLPQPGGDAVAGDKSIGFCCCDTAVEVPIPWWTMTMTARGFVTVVGDSVWPHGFSNISQ
jgi:hypothetical protein